MTDDIAGSARLMCTKTTKREANGTNITLLKLDKKQLLVAYLWRAISSRDGNITG